VSSISEADLAFRQGEHYRDRDKHEMARSAFGKALDLDPKLAAAAAEIAMLYADGRLADSLQVERWAKRALEMDARSGRAYAALADASHGSRRPDAATRLVYALKAASFEPGYPPALKALVSTLSDPDLARRAYAEWRRMVPLDGEPMPATGPSLSPEDERSIILRAHELEEAPEFLMPLPSNGSR
jgi:tetratricopeptide (TPR) repeat protein